MDSLKCYQQYFKFNSIFYWQPVESIQNRSDMTIAWRISNKSSGHVLYSLQFFGLSFWKTIEQRISGVAMGGNGEVRTPPPPTFLQDQFSKTSKTEEKMLGGGEGGKVRGSHGLWKPVGVRIHARFGPIL